MAKTWRPRKRDPFAEGGSSWAGTGDCDWCGKYYDWGVYGGYCCQKCRVDDLGREVSDKWEIAGLNEAKRLIAEATEQKQIAATRMAAAAEKSRRETRRYLIGLAIVALIGGWLSDWEFRGAARLFGHPYDVITEKLKSVYENNPFQ